MKDIIVPACDNCASHNVTLCHDNWDEIICADCEFTTIPNYKLINQLTIEDAHKELNGERLEVNGISVLIYRSEIDGLMAVHIDTTDNDEIDSISDEPLVKVMMNDATAIEWSN